MHPRASSWERASADRPLRRKSGLLMDPGSDWLWARALGSREKSTAGIGDGNAA